MGAAVFHQKLEVAYTQIVRMSMDDHHILKASRASVGAQRTILPTPTERFRMSSSWRATSPREGPDDPALPEAWTAVDLLPSIDAKVQKQSSHDVEASCPLFIT